MTTADKTRWTIIWIAIIAAIGYTCFAIWAIFINTYDEPQVYNMKFMDRWDASYDYKGSRTQSYKGYWKEEKSGNVLTLSIDSYMMYRMHLGEVVPMSFKPSRVGLQEDHGALYGFFPAAWLAIFTVLGFIVGGTFFVSWLFGFDDKEEEWDIM